MKLLINNESYLPKGLDFKLMLFQIEINKQYYSFFLKPNPEKVNWNKLMTLDQNLDFKMQVNEGTISIDISKKNNENVSIIREILMFYANYDESFIIKLFKTLNINDKYIQYIKQSNDTNSYFDFNILDNYTHTYLYYPDSDISIDKLGRLTLNELQGYIFNVLLILQFSTNTPLKNLIINHRDNNKISVKKQENL